MERRGGGVQGRGREGELVHVATSYLTWEVEVCGPEPSMPVSGAEEGEPCWMQKTEKPSRKSYGLSRTWKQHCPTPTLFMLNTYFIQHDLMWSLQCPFEQGVTVFSVLKFHKVSHPYHGANKR